MYLSKIKISNYRNFKDQEIIFNDGMNVIIGHNNAGKTNLIQALSLVIDTTKSKRLSIDDFHKNISLDELKSSPPKITISVTIAKGEEETPDDLVTIANWLTKLENSYEALLTYEFFLPEKKHNSYIEALSVFTESNDEPAEDKLKTIDKAWKVIKQDFLRFYVYKIWGGDVSNQATADSESLQKFDFQFLDAIRDVERDMLSGQNTLLREVFDFFMDYEIKKDGSKTFEQKAEEIKNKKEQFTQKADVLIEDLTKRIKEGKKEILSYATKTGASFNKAKPSFTGSIAESEMYSVLKLIVEYESGITIPATHNGLGYNNLIFMSLLLAKMQVNANIKYLDNNAKVFNTLAIEEPEAHLHPAMQYKFLKFLNENKSDKKVRQVFVTTHSTHITSALSLDQIICLHNDNGQTQVGYPKKVFPETKNKKYVQRFLDATKSDMLFAQKVLFVEGIAEQLLMSVLGKYIDKSLEDNHVAVINVGGRYFEHFLYLFDSTKEHTIHKKIVCITDRDPTRKEKPNGKFKKCYPYEFQQDLNKYEYQNNPFSDKYPKDSHQNITVFSSDRSNGKTLEYELLMCNPSCQLFLTESMSNKNNLEELMTLYEDNTSTVEDLLNKLGDSEENTRIIESINQNSTLNDDDKKKSIIASRYLNSIGKGENALELSYVLAENFSKKGTDEFINISIPQYIKDAIEELC
ncbi:AAA family ATPase [Psychrobacter sp. HD31]|uniref:ATP-dependent nuclease n=1 Tax=Psychrobacter sp. HD31 TaxID=3112003 RepID=UPI003DA3EADB